MTVQIFDHGDDHTYSHFENYNNISKKPSEIAFPKVTYKVELKDDIFRYQSRAKKIARIAWLIFSILIVPVGIARLIGKVINHYSTKFGFVQGVTIKRETCDFYREAYTHDRRFKRIAIETADHVKLDTGMVENPKQMKELVQNRKYIIFFNGNAGTYEGMMSTLINISEKTGANVYCGNYRGVGYSEGFPTCVQDLVMDGEAMVQYLLSQGVQPQNILIHGWSLGGGVGAHVAALHQEKGKEIHICNDRSFESMVNEVKELARELRKYINTSTLLGKLVSAALALAPITIPLIHMIGWDFKSTQCYQKINGHKFIIYHPNDEIIVYSASLHKKLEDMMKVKPHSHLKHVIKLDCGGNAHCTPIDETHHFDIYQVQVGLALS